MIFLLISFSIPAQISLIYGHGLKEFSAIYNKMTIFNILVIGVCLYNFYYCLNASDNVKWSFPLSIGIICFNNAMVLVYGNDFESYSVILATIVYTLVSAYFLLTHETDIINHPDSHWWRIPQRYTLKEKVIITTQDGILQYGSTFDLSQGGAFIVCDTDRYNFTEGEQIKVNIGEDSTIICQAKVVRKAKAKGIYPSGLGLQFTEISLIDKFRLKQRLLSNRLATAA